MLFTQRGKGRRVLSGVDMPLILLLSVVQGYKASYVPEHNYHAERLQGQRLILKDV
jgi:hypothetical protein